LFLESLILAPSLHAQINLGPVTVGAGLQASYQNTETSGTSSNDNEFLLNSVRLYINGPVTDKISFMFNTEYDGGTNKIGILDAVGEIAINPKVNIWVGRFLPPSDRANLYGPYYSNEFKVYTDGIQDGYPFVATGRDNGVLYWGQFQKVKVSAGVFDGKTATGSSKMLGAARVQIDFWDKEDGYYLNGTYYGDKNLLAIGGATQFQGAFTIESEYTNYNGLGGYDGGFFKSQGAYGLASYLFPKTFNFGKYPGKFELLGKYAKADFTHAKITGVPTYDQKTTEINFDYVIKQFNARIMTFYKDTRFNSGPHPDFWQAGIGLQLQM
jgi:hypothetical protein